MLHLIIKPDYHNKLELDILCVVFQFCSFKGIFPASRYHTTCVRGHDGNGNGFTYVSEYVGICCISNQTPNLSDLQECKMLHFNIQELEVGGL